MRKSLSHEKRAPRHFLELKEVASGELRRIVDMGASFKRGEKLNGTSRPADGRALAMIFEKPSTRTRVSFEIAMKQLGGTVVVVLTPNEMQIGRGETIADTARVLSLYVDAIMVGRPKTRNCPSWQPTPKCRS